MSPKAFQSISLEFPVAERLREHQEEWETYSDTIERLINQQ